MCLSEQHCHCVGPSSFGGLLDDGGEGSGQLPGLLTLTGKGFGLGWRWPAVVMAGVWYR